MKEIEDQTCCMQVELLSLCKQSFISFLEVVEEHSRIPECRRLTRQYLLPSSPVSIHKFDENTIWMWLIRMLFGREWKKVLASNLHPVMDLQQLVLLICLLPILTSSFVTTPGSVSVMVEFISTNLIQFCVYIFDHNYNAPELYYTVCQNFYFAFTDHWSTFFH